LSFSAVEPELKQKFPISELPYIPKHYGQLMLRLFPWQHYLSCIYVVVSAIAWCRSAPATGQFRHPWDILAERFNMLNIEC
jgi:hypothetical protein